MTDLTKLELFAWVGEDEMGSGDVGLKQARVPAGIIPIVATTRDKVDQEYIRVQMARQQTVFGKKIQLVRFVFAEIVDSA